MTRRLIQWLTAATPEHQSHPHFHQGPDHTPSACYDARCASPRLDV